MLPYRYDHTVRVRYAETDKMGVCWHGNYLLYLEEARGEALRATGFGSYADMEKAGVMTPMVHLDLHYCKPAYYDDVLTVHVTVEDPVRSTIRFLYDVVNQNGDRVLTAVTELAFITSDTHQPCRPPLAMRQFFRKEAAHE